MFLKEELKEVVWDYMFVGRLFQKSRGKNSEILERESSL